MLRLEDGGKIPWDWVIQLYPLSWKRTGPVVVPLKKSFVGRPAVKILKKPLLDKARLYTLRLHFEPLDDYVLPRRFVRVFKRRFHKLRLFWMKHDLP